MKPFLTLFLLGICLSSVKGQHARTYNLPQLLREGKISTTPAQNTQVLDSPYNQGITSTGTIWLKDVHFTEGTIDIDLRGKDVFLRSFLGLAFHAADTSHYELVLLRPFNFRYPDTARRRWSVQYQYTPDYPYDKLRRDHPLVYENAVDPIPDPSGWFHATIVIKGGWISVYVNHSPKPSLQVRALVPNKDGMLGLWSDWLSGDFANLVITPAVPVYTTNRPLGPGQQSGAVHMEDGEDDGIAWINDKTFTNGTIEFDVRGRDSLQHSFVGLALHGANDTTWEAIYFRPFNFRSIDPVHKAHAVQYIAAPDHDWKTLRDQYPGKYEQPVNPAPDPNDWVHVRVTVQGKQIAVFVNGQNQPSLQVESLDNSPGLMVGLWAGTGSDGQWKDVTITGPMLTGSHAYVDQMPPGEKPVRFQPPHLTDSGYFVLGRVAMSQDGSEFYYGVNNAWYSNDHQTLDCFRFEDGVWKGPLELNEHYAQPTFSADGQTLFVSDNNGVQQMHRDGAGWTPPASYLNRSYALYNFMPTRSGRSYVGSNGTWGPGGEMNSWRFSVLPPDLADTSIQSLGQPLNSPGFNGDFYIAPDESYIIISAKETKDFECELWISFRKSDGSWDNPHSLGPAINDGPAHRFGQYVTPDGQYLFYTKGTSDKDCALYWVRFDHLLERLRRSVR